MEISIPPISINSEYETAARPLTKDEYSSLVDSIREHGLRDPIVTNEKGIILDGHNRFRACQELGIKLQPDDFIVKQFDNLYEEQIYVYEVNLLRRQLNPAQRVAQVLKTKEIYQKLAKLNMSKGGSGIQIQTPLERVTKHLAARADVKPTKFFHIEYGLNNGSDDQQRKLLSGQLKPNKLYGDLRDELDLKKRIALNEKLHCDFLSSPDKCKLLKGDFREMSKQIESNSIPLIFTDPPYDEKHIWVYEPLGEIANRILEPGGSLICYINQFKLFEIGEMLRKSLKHWSGFYVALQGPKFPRHYDRQMVIKIKHLLWFVKGSRPINSSFPKDKSSKRFMLEDLIDSTKPMKQFHKWGQSPVEAGYCIEHLTSINDQVVDLFLGEGTTAIAAMNLQRRFIGIDIDSKAIRDTETNLKLNQSRNLK